MKRLTDYVTSERMGWRLGLCVWKGVWCGEESGVGRRVVWGWGEVCCGEEGVGFPKLAMASPWGDVPKAYYVYFILKIPCLREVVEGG